MPKIELPKKLAAFTKNIGWMMFKNIYSMLVSLIVGSLSARYLGPSNYGLLNYGVSIIVMFSTLSKLGMDTVIVAEMVRNPKKEGAYIGTALVMRFVVSVFSLLLIMLIIRFCEPQNRLLQYVTILQASAILFQSTDVFVFWFQAHWKMKYVTLSSVLALTVTSLWRISLLVNAASVEWFALSSSISSLVAAIVIISCFFKKANIKVKFKKKEVKFIWRKSHHFLINGLAVVIYTQIDRLMIGKFIGIESVGFYSAASSISVMWEFIPIAVINSANPFLFEKYSSSITAFENLYRYLLLAISILGMGVGITMLFASKIIIDILYGKAYYAAIPALQILIWATSFALIGSARTTWIICKDKNKYAKYFTLMGAFLNVVLNFFVIPKWGILGASFTTLISQIFVSLVAPFMFKETRGFVYIFFSSFRKVPEILKNIINRFKKN